MLENNPVLGVAVYVSSWTPNGMLNMHPRGAGERANSQDQSTAFVGYSRIRDVGRCCPWP